MDAINEQKTMLEARHAALGSGWVRLPRAGEKVSGLSRSFLYELITANKIRSHVIKKPHATKGIRLLYVPSIVAYIESQTADKILPSSNQ